MNRRIVSGLLGYLTLFCGAAMIPPFILAATAEEFNGAAAFLLAIFLCLAATFELERFGGLQGKDNVGIREGIAVTGLGWLLISILGLVPYFAGGYLNLLDSLVESISGFSGTGATVIEDVEILPRSILLWRSMSNWFGGLGIVVIFMAIMPQFGRGGMFILKAETTGPTKDRQMPRIRDNAKALFSIYVLLTIICAIGYMLCGLQPFAAINHAMTTIATGGYSVFNGTVSEYGNPYLEYCMAFFMIVSSGSFAMYVVAYRKGPGVILRNTEFRTYLMIITVAAIVVAGDLIIEMQVDTETATRAAIFHIASLSSTTGFVAHDFDAYPPVSKAFMLVTMFLGGCAGSTAGGWKVARIILLFKFVVLIVRQKLHPNVITQIKLSGRTIDEDVVYGAAKFFFAVVVMDVLFAAVMMFDGIDFVNSISVSVSTMASVGPGFGIEGATSTYALLPDLSKFCACGFMFLSRLEIFTVLALMSPSFWNTSKNW
ncbi:MAG: TrkH family potassium uptake protein [Selenomonadaceae bacterium]|nr:TrkH family potassium uptake protein [Selenomonadaceae bacterium]